jgi:hypothetical protein
VSRSDIATIPVISPGLGGSHIEHLAVRSTSPTRTLSDRTNATSYCE